MYLIDFFFAVLLFLYVISRSYTAKLRTLHSRVQT
jgi:hypothetical protein